MSIELGYCYQNQFYPVDPQARLGYYYNNAFYDIEIDYNYDFNSDPSACKVMLTQTGYTDLSGCEFYYRRNGQLFTSRRLAMEHLLHTQPTLPHGGGVTKMCSICKTRVSDTKTYSGKVYCLGCLGNKIIDKEFYFGDGEERKDWSFEMVYEIYTAVVQGRLTNLKGQLDSACPIPPGYFICCGDRKVVKDDYPPYGHIAGDITRVGDQGCPDPMHPFCKPCASKTTHCPYCGQPIYYEEPELTDPDCANHCPNFEKPCSSCKKTSQRKKHRPL